jgi:O-antigen/teichoic acid export membrane protein
MKPSALGEWFRRAWRSAMLFAVLGTAVRVGANLLLIPLVLHYLTPAEQALWWVFIALGNFANLADFGFGQVISRVYSYLYAGAEDFDAEGLRPPPQTATPNLARIRELNVTVGRLYFRITAIATVVLATGGSVFLMRPIAESQLGRPAWFLWAGYLGVMAFSLGSSHWSLASQGVNQVRASHLALLSSSVVYLVAAAIMLIQGLGLASMIFATALRAVLLREMARQAYARVVPAGPGPALRPDFRILARLWPNARKFGILSIGGYLLTNGSVLISSHFLGVATTASVGLTTQVGWFLSNFSNLWLSVKWPQITMLRAQGRLEEMAVLFARRLGLVMGTWLLGGAAILLLGNAVLGWKGTTTRLLDTPYLVVFLAYLGHQILYTNFGMLALTENVVPFFWVGLGTGIAMLLLSLVLTPLFGLWGLVLAPFLAEVAYSGWFTIRRGFRGQPLLPDAFLRAALGGLR